MAQQAESMIYPANASLYQHASMRENPADLQQNYRPYVEVRRETDAILAPPPDLPLKRKPPVNLDNALIPIGVFCLASGLAVLLRLL